MKISDTIAAVEAILFASGEPVSPDKISSALGTDNETVIKIIGQLERRYNVSESGLRIIRLAKAYQITTRPEYSEHIKTVLESKKQTPLSPASMEALAIIAYNQPITKAFVEQVRGVDSGGVVNTLVERGLVEEAGRMDLPGRPIAYRTSENFLRCFGLSSLDELPIVGNKEEQLNFEEMEDVKTDINKSNSNAEVETGTKGARHELNSTENDTEIYDYI